jgi:hypothetical protein
LDGAPFVRWADGFAAGAEAREEPLFLRLEVVAAVRFLATIDPK